VRLFTRNGHDWTAKMQSLADEVEKLGIRNAWFDCEAVVMDANGLPSFNALQNSFEGRHREHHSLCVRRAVP
jgi:bifunctional non-homologous end joining protein LigD